MTPPPAPPERPGAYVWMISLTAALGGLLFGYDWVVIGGAKPFYEKFFALETPARQGWAMSCALVGCLGGALAAGAAGDRWGRRRLLILSALLFALSSAGTALAGSFAAFVGWRILGGVAIGLASNLSPLYISEAAPAALRGRLVSLNQFTIVIGILLAQAVNWGIAQPVPAGATAQEIVHSWNGQVGWRWMFGVTALPSLLFLAGMCLAPESPRWLAARGREDQARAILRKIGGERHAGVEMQSIAASLRADAAGAAAGAPSGWGMLREPGVRRAAALAVVLAVFQQWCGINVIFNYAEEVFSSAGYPLSDILFNIVVTGATNLLFSLVALVLVDRLGRRALMRAGAAALAGIYLLLGLCFFLHLRGLWVLLLVVLAIAAYAASLAPVTWVIISEIFPRRARSKGAAAAVASLWIACFALTYSFPFIDGALGIAGTFWLYAAVCLAGFLFLTFRLPETCGKTLEEIERIWETAPSPPKG